MTRDEMIESLEDLADSIRIDNQKRLLDDSSARITRSGSSGLVLALENISLALRDDIPLASIGERTKVDIRHLCACYFGRGEGMVGYVLSGVVSKDVCRKAGEAINLIIDAMNKKSGYK